VNALRTIGYEAVWQGERSWNGVAILARNHVPVLTCTSLPGNPADHQARYIEAAVQGVLITSIYLPNGNPQPGPKFNYKLAWFERLIAHAAELMASGAPVVLGHAMTLLEFFEMNRPGLRLCGRLSRRRPGCALLCSSGLRA
jgi:exodeoxyribonuclease-3